MKRTLEEILSLETIDVSDQIIPDKHRLFDVMAGMLLEAGRIADKSSFTQALYQREDTGSTYMGDGLVVPHGKSETVIKPSIAFCRFQPFVYDADDEVAQIALMLAIPSRTEQSEYISMLAHITRLFLDDNFVKVLKSEKNKEVILQEFADRYAAITI